MQPQAQEVQALRLLSFQAMAVCEPVHSCLLPSTAAGHSCPFASPSSRGTVESPPELAPLYDQLSELCTVGGGLCQRLLL